MLERLNIKDLRVAMKIAKLNNDCGRIDCDDCLYTGENCNKEANDLLAELLKAEIKRREAKENGVESPLRKQAQGVNEISGTIETFNQQSNKTYRSKVTTESAVVETTVDGLSFEEIKILVNGE